MTFRFLSDNITIMDKKLINILRTKTTFFFDYDGTIVDNEKLHFLAHKINMKQYGFNLKKQDFLDCCICRSSEDIMDCLEKRFNFKIKNREQFWDRFLDIDLRVMTENQQTVFPYIDEIFRLFPNIDKIIISNESMRVLRAFLSNAKLASKFDALYSCFMREPKAVTLQNLKRVFNVFPQDAVLFEDSQKNIDAAKQAGIFTIGITHNYNHGLQADYIIKKGM